MIQYMCNEDSMKPKCILDWYDVNKRCIEITNIIKSKYNSEEIELFGVSRGGLIPATIIAYKLGVRLKTLDVYSYDNDDKQGKLKVGSDTHNIDWSKKFIIIDDIYDTGQTYNFLNKIYEDSDFYFIIDKREINDDIWYVFPWER